MAGLLLSRLRNRWFKVRSRTKTLDPLGRANLTALDHLRPDQKAKSLRYVVFDLETTGLHPRRDRVVSVAAYRIADSRILLGDVFSSLVKPGRDIPSSAVKIHGIVPFMVNDAPTFESVFDQFLGYLGTDILVGYHVAFDLHFLNRHMRQRYGFPLQNLALDVRFMCQRVTCPPHLRPYATRIAGDLNLDAMASRFDIEIHERHTALGDALATAMIFQRLLAEIDRTGPGLLRNLLATARKG